MSIPVHCKTCGYRGIARSILIENSTDVTFQGGSEDCPRCGGRAAFVSGTYDFVGTMMTAFREVSRDNIAAFRDIAEAVKTGQATKEEAESQIAELSSILATVWKWTNDNGGGLGVLLAILSIYLTFSAGWSADETAAKLQASVEKQTQVEQMILAELQKQNGPAPKQGASRQPKSQMRALAPQQRPMQAKPNRHERRKAAAKARRQPL